MKFIRVYLLDDNEPIILNTSLILRIKQGGAKRTNPLAEPKAVWKTTTVDVRMSGNRLTDYRVKVEGWNKAVRAAGVPDLQWID